MDTNGSGTVGTGCGMETPVETKDIAEKPAAQTGGKLVGTQVVKMTVVAEPVEAGADNSVNRYCKAEFFARNFVTSAANPQSSWEIKAFTSF